METKLVARTDSVKDTGEFTGLASVYGVKDLQGDVVDKGAFTKSLAANGNTVPILWQHDPTQPIGLGTLVDTAAGLQIKGQLDLDNSVGRTAYSGMKKRYLDGLSIGYDVAKQSYNAGARHLQEVRLYEVSVVTFPANTDARVSGVKHRAPRTVEEALRANTLALRSAILWSQKRGLEYRFERLNLAMSLRLLERNVAWLASRVQ